MKILSFSSHLRLFGMLCLVVVLAGEVQAQVAKLPSKHYQYQQVDLEEMVRRYISKTPEPGSIEGIYSVSALVMKKSRNFLTGNERERPVNRKDNYARVAILKDWPGSKTEYVELSLNDSNAPKYPITAEIVGLSEGGGFLFKHFEPDNEHMTFTFSLDEFPDILHGAYAVSKKRAVITYKLSYLRVYPKTTDIVTR